MGRTQTTLDNYSPWRHAEHLGAAIIYRDDLPDPLMIAAYSPETDCIYVRNGLRLVLERCALAHEIVHFEHGDSGTAKDERRADRIAADRLINQARLDTLLAQTLDLELIARELDVTVRMLTIRLALPELKVMERGA